MGTTPRRKLSSDEIQELVRLIAPRDGLLITQVEHPHELNTRIDYAPNPGRAVLISVGPRFVLVSWKTGDTDQSDVRARSGREVNGVSLDPVNLIRCAVGWLIGEDLPPWPDLSSDWEWDDPEAQWAAPAAPGSRRSDSDDCGGDLKPGDSSGPGRAGEGLP